LIPCDPDVQVFLRDHPAPVFTLQDDTLTFQELQMADNLRYAEEKLLSLQVGEELLYD
jgi:hypothetical protein